MVGGLDAPLEAGRSYKDFRDRDRLMFLVVASGKWRLCVNGESVLPVPGSLHDACK